MIKWMSRNASNRSKSLLPSAIIALFIVAMLLISGPAQAVTMSIIGNQQSYTKGEDIDFQLIIELNEKDKYVPLTNISLDLIGNVSKHAVFMLDGTQISGTCNIKMSPISVPSTDDFGYGYGYDSGYGYNLGYGYGYGYGYGGGGEKINFIYNVTIGTTCLPAGHYSVVATLNTDQKIAFQNSFEFELKQGNKFNANVEIKPETINLASKGVFTAFITSDEFDVEDIEGNSIKVNCDGCNSVHAVNWNTANNKFISKFRTEDLENVDTGNVTFIVTGKLKNGSFFEGSDTIKVIDQGKGQKELEECECDDHAKEDDHDDECADNVKEHDHKEKKAKDQKPEKNEDHDQKNKKNGGQARNNIVNNNNIYITNNTGTVNINIYNQGSGTDVNQGGNNNNNANGNKKGNQGNNNNRGNNGNGNNGKNKK